MTLFEIGQAVFTGAQHSKTYIIAVERTERVTSLRCNDICSRQTKGIGIVMMATSLTTFNKAAQAYHVLQRQPCF